ncbi:unnamed protein product [Porites lobata]|uniref:Uncharacterized protein n=1 Tax=Porites lobata TaxID=104759 RepID=A0ABN8NEM6_9CNID|nr:unnamed protein product [Porites lobata]
MNRAFGQRLSEMMMTESPLRDQQDNSKQRVSVEEIVYNEKFVYMNRLSEARIETEKLLHSSDLSKVQKKSHMEREISNMLMESRDNTQRVRDSFGSSSRLDIATSCIQHIAEKASLSELYRKKIAELRLQLSVKEDVICALQHDLKSKCLKQQLPEIALQLAAVVERKDQKNTEFISIVSDLLAHNINEKKCWNDDTKSLFAIILDYGGLALLKIIREKIGGPSLQTAYATARRKVPIATKLTEDQFGIAASFYQRVGYTGPFVLAIDATAISPCLRVRGNRIVGIASEEDILYVLHKILSR